MKLLRLPRYLGISLVVSIVLSACSMAKIETRLEANPQCREVINPKTGATMPCPGPEKIARSQVNTVVSGTAPATPLDNVANPNPLSTSAPATSAPNPVIPVAPAMPKAQPAQPTPLCKPQMNTKTGTLMPCPNG